MKTEKDLSAPQRNAYLKALSALEMGNHALISTLLGPVVAEEPEFLAGRKLLRESQIMKSKGSKGGFLGMSGGGLSLGRSKVKKFIDAGDWKGAFAEAEKAIASDPIGVQPNKELFEAAKAAAESERSAVQAAEAAFEVADEAAKGGAARQVEIGRGKLQSYEAIARFALETITNDPKNTKIHHELGDYLMSIADFDGASKVFEEIIRKTPGDLDAREKAKEAAARRSMQGGGKSIEEKTERRRQEEESQGRKHVGGEETPEELARKVYEAHEAGSPDRESARKLADLYFNAEHYDNALDYYRYLSALANETDPGLLRKISDTEARKLARAIADKERALDGLAGDDAEAATLRAEIEKLRRERAELMLGEARKRVERNPTDLQYRFELGEQLVLAGHYKEAIPELQKARSNPNTRTKALNMLGKCYTELNMLDLAAKTLTDAAAEIPGMDGTKKDILYNLGLVYERMGNTEKSLDCMKQIYEADYGYLDVAERVESSYTA